MGWRFWPDICKEYYYGMVYAYDLMVYYDDYHRDPALRRFFVALEKSDLPNWAKENFLTMFSFNYITFTQVFFANKGIIEATDRAEEWEQEQKRGLIEIKNILASSGEKDITNGESLKYLGISMLPKMLDNQEYCFTIDGEEVRGTKTEFIERFKKTLLSDKVQKDNDSEETTEISGSYVIGPVEIEHVPEESMQNHEENNNEIKIEKISYKDFLDFLASDLNEVEYFGCDKTSLMLLKDYLLELKQKNEEYYKLISEPLKSIQSKNKWVKNIKPDHYLDDKGLVVYGTRNPIFLLGIQPEYLNAKDYISIGGPFGTLFLEQKLKNKEKLLENSQEELHEINRIAHQLNVIEKPFGTISGRFEIDPTEYGRCDIRCFDWPIIRCDFSKEKLCGVKPMMFKETFYKKEGMYPKPLTAEERERLVRKLYIKR